MSFVVTMLLQFGLTHIQSQIKPWLLFGKSFTLIIEMCTAQYLMPSVGECSCDVCFQVCWCAQRLVMTRCQNTHLGKDHYNLYLFQKYPCTCGQIWSSHILQLLPDITWHHLSCSLQVDDSLLVLLVSLCCSDVWTGLQALCGSGRQ